MNSLVCNLELCGMHIHTYYIICMLKNFIFIFYYNITFLQPVVYNKNKILPFDSRRETNFLNTFTSYNFKCKRWNRKYVIFIDAVLRRSPEFSLFIIWCSHKINSFLYLYIICVYICTHLHIHKFKFTTGFILRECNLLLYKILCYLEDPTPNALPPIICGARISKWELEFKSSSMIIFWEVIKYNSIQRLFVDINSDGKLKQNENKNHCDISPHRGVLSSCK